MANRYKGPPAEKRALEAYVKLRRAEETVTGNLVRDMTKAGLTESQFGVLEALHHIGPLCQRELAGKLLKTSGNITMVIDNLEKSGWVQRQREQNDRRVVTVRLTGGGSRLIKRLFPRHARAVKAQMGALTVAEQKELARLCRKLGIGSNSSREKEPAKR